MAKPFPRLSFAIDRGGTFTDVIAQITGEDGATEVRSLKLLSRDPDHYPDAPSEGIRRVLAQCSLTSTTDAGIPTAHIEAIRMGTTVATNALLEAKGERSCLITTKGFGDVLEIGNQARPKIFELDIRKPKMLYEDVVEVQERVRLVRADEVASLGEQPKPASWRQGVNGSFVDVVQTVEEAALEEALRKVVATGVKSAAVSLLHSYVDPTHEQQVKCVAQRAGFTNVSTSSELMPMIKHVSRTTTASVDASVSPLIQNYIAQFRQHFQEDLQGVTLQFIQSDGGLTDATTFHGFRAVLSGPAGGAVGCAVCTSHQLGEDTKIVGFDMGGTSTDVCRCEGASVEHVVEAEIAFVTVQAPQVDVHTVAAGGGSILTWRNKMFCVGPESAGAYPGPACYGRDGPVTVTDANLVLGHIHEDFFPNVFGKSGKEPLSRKAAEEGFAKLAEEVSKDTKGTLSIEQLASDFLAVANESMCRAIKKITEARGYRCSEHALSTFGGAGAQHACAVASNLGIKRVYIHRFASFLSAVGIGLSDVVEEAQEHCGAVLTKDSWTTQSATVEQLRSRCAGRLQSQGFPESALVLTTFFNLRFAGTSTSMMVPYPEDGNFEAAFIAKYKKEFGFVLTGKDIIIDDIRVRALGKAASASSILKASPVREAPYAATEGKPSTPMRVIRSYFDNAWYDTAVHKVEAGIAPITGPAILVGDGTTIVVDPNTTAFVCDDGSLVLHTGVAKEAVTTAFDPLALSIFAHRFMSIAEQMGNTLQRTAISTNIKERLDFSCALFDKHGRLVANAPHIPVHLGAMGSAVQFQREFWGAEWKDGETVLSNHPTSGGSHLPDITVMTPYYHNGEVVFYIASRGHHADIGGTTPGSMPPFSRTLEEEGAAFKAMKVVDEKGNFLEQDIIDGLMAPGKLEGMSGCRTLQDVLSDLKAQVAANQRGCDLLRDLVGTYSVDVVQAYMGYIQESAEFAVRALLRDVGAKFGTSLEAVDEMDDGTEIHVKIDINLEEGSATFDFSKSGDQVLGSTNCPTAVVKSAIIYCLRCMVGSDIPLNQGCMAPISVITRNKSILQPDEKRAVVAGNVLTSQRVTDVILLALHAAACSQGCMNNFTMGNDTFAYYETICGGSGAGSTFNGTSAVQTHMTNTRITDAEVLESRYPVLLEEFAIRRFSGGAGKFRGGDGVRRRMMFLAPMTACILSERRVHRPRGLDGGSEGTRGRNTLLYNSGDDTPLFAQVTNAMEVLTGRKEDSRSAVNLGGKNSISVNVGDTMLIESPGGGGFGTA